MRVVGMMGRGARIVAPLLLSLMLLVGAVPAVCLAGPRASERARHAAGTAEHHAAPTSVPPDNASSPVPMDHGDGFELCRHVASAAPAYAPQQPDINIAPVRTTPTTVAIPPQSAESPVFVETRALPPPNGTLATAANLRI